MKNNYTILVVDQSPIIVERMSSLLAEIENIGLVANVSSYPKALKYLDKNVIDIIIMDTGLTKGNVFETIKTIKERKQPNAIVMVMSDYASDTTELFLKAGANYFYDKFGDFEDIGNMIGKFRSLNSGNG